MEERAETSKKELLETCEAVTIIETPPMIVFPEYKHPGKKWRVKQGAMPQWYKARSGVRTRALSGAARVARFRPRSSIQG
jgi:sec-independent protein translocase protein TatB